MIVAQAVPSNSAHVVGFDTDEKLTLISCANLFLAGFAFAVRYVSLRDDRGSLLPADLDAAEVGAITDAGLALLTVQHARSRGWSVETGVADGVAAARQHLELGIPAEVTLSCDLESDGALSGGQAVDYAEAWWEAARNGGAKSLMLYVGAGVPLSAVELFHKLPFGLYWKSGSIVPDVTRRGYAMVQLSPFDQVVSGVTLDLDVIGSDHLGGRPVWARRTS